MNQDKILHDLRADGISILPELFPDVGKVAEHLSACPTYPGHVKVYSTNRGLPTRCFDMSSVISAPGFFRYALGFSHLAAKFLDVPVPRLYSFNGFWTYPVPARDPGPMDLHRDNDDLRMLVLYLYVTDVMSEADGAHIYTKRDGSQYAVTGPAGTLFISDVSQPHCGLKPETKPRLLLWARWGISNPTASYVWEHLAPVPRSQVPDYPQDLWLQKTVELVAA